MSKTPGKASRALSAGGSGRSGDCGGSRGGGGSGGTVQIKTSLTLLCTGSP
ncbi:MAG TPA: hypothetical protein VGJ84_23995 [Polyangiaceae bacterium]